MINMHIRVCLKMVDSPPHGWLFFWGNFWWTDFSIPDSSTFELHGCCLKIYSTWSPLLEWIHLQWLRTLLNSETSLDRPSDVMLICDSFWWCLDEKLLGLARIYYLSPKQNYDEPWHVGKLCSCSAPEIEKCGYNIAPNSSLTAPCSSKSQVWVMSSQLLH